MENVENAKCFVNRVIAALKGGDEKKLAKFQKGVLNWAKDQIKEIKARMEKNIERVEESEEALDEYLLAVDLGAIATTDERDEYIIEYTKGYDDMIAAIDGLNEKIEDDQALIAKREALVKKMS